MTAAGAVGLLAAAILLGLTLGACGEPPGLENLNIEGFGAESIGGAGGRVIWVTNLNDNGPGSFREGVTAEGPRIVKFQVGGIIPLESQITVRSGRLTIDGASAIDKGWITLHGGTLVFGGLTCSDVICHNIRVRRGSDGTDGMSIWEGARRVVLDHCSICWADDENIGINQGHFVTVQWCIISEPVDSHYGMLVCHGANNISIHHNFWSGCRNRNPLLHGVGGYGRGGAMQGCYPGEDYARFMPEALYDFRNNLVFNYGGGSQLMQGDYANIVNNFYHEAPGRQGTEIDLAAEICYPGSEQPRAYIAGNISPRQADPSGDQWAMVRINGDFSSEPRRDTPFLVPAPRTMPAANVPSAILAQSGAFPRDDVDQRLIAEYPNDGSVPEDTLAAWLASHGLQ